MRGGDLGWNNAIRNSLAVIRVEVLEREIDALIRRGLIDAERAPTEARFGLLCTNCSIG
jgi:hypothetical protein